MSKTTPEKMAAIERSTPTMAGTTTAVALPASPPPPLESREDPSPSLSPAAFRDTVSKAKTRSEEPASLLALTRSS